MHSFDIFCSSNHAKFRKVEISKIWIRGRLACFVDSVSMVGHRVVKTECLFQTILMICKNWAESRIFFYPLMVFATDFNLLLNWP